jgi:response regulator of citrate/malate metabolism
LQLQCVQQRRLAGVHPAMSHTWCTKARTAGISRQAIRKRMAFLVLMDRIVPTVAPPTCDARRRVQPR